MENTIAESSEYLMASFSSNESNLSALEERVDSEQVSRQRKRRCCRDTQTWITSHHEMEWYET